MEIAFGSLSSSSACLSPLFPAAGAVRRPPATLGRPRPNPTSPPLHVAPPRASGPSSPRAGAPSLRHAAQNRLAAATATPPWRARSTTPGRQLARAPASGEPEHSILCALSLAPRSGSPEHYRLRHYRPSSELAADSHPPPFPPAINPANRSASLSRSSLTSSRRLSYTKNPSRRAPP